MEVNLRGSSPGATTAGIMLMTRARQLGYRLDVCVVGDPEDIVPITGPAVLYAPVLAGCGVGREFGSGATVVIPGPASAPLMVSVHPHGETGWFFVDRVGAGFHPATQAFVRLQRDPRPAARELAKLLRQAMDSLGLSSETAVLDVLFGADVAPLTRIAIGLRAGRAISGVRGAAVTRFIGGMPPRDPLPQDPELDYRDAVARDVGWVINSLSVALRDPAEHAVELAMGLAKEDGGRDLACIWHLAEVGSHLVQLPAGAMLPPIGAAEDSVATALRAALHAEGDDDANRALVQVFRFLGGTYTSTVPSHVLELEAALPPPAGDRVGRWQWFCSEVRRGRKAADAHWANIVDPPH
jgi:hypothetical protein